MRSLEIALADGLEEHVARAYCNLSSIAVQRREHQEAASVFTDGIAYCERLDLDSWRIYMVAWRAIAELQAADYDAAVRSAEEVLRNPRVTLITRVPALVALGLVRARRGDPEAIGPLDQALEAARPTGELQRLAPVAAARAELAWLAYDTEGAVEATELAWELARSRQERWMTGELAVWRRRAGVDEPVPDAIAEPYALELAGDTEAAAAHLERAWLPVRGGARRRRRGHARTPRRACRGAAPTAARPARGDAPEPRRADRARAAGAGAGGRRAHEPRDRRAARGVAPDGRSSRVVDPLQARRPDAGASSRQAGKPHESSGLKGERRRADLDRDMAFDLDHALRYLIAAEGSDLHLKVPSYPLIRLHGHLEAIPDTERLYPEDTERALGEMLNDSDKVAEFNSENEVDFSYAVEGLGRFRVNAFRQRGSVSIVMRAIPVVIKSVDELGLPEVVTNLAEEERGIILLTGTTGSGKSTTLAAMLDHMNRSMHKHIVTIEDPIEFLHRDRNSIINQREVGADTASFKRALRRVLRQDPDTILIGEMRDEETVHTALSAAETGHLVLSTLHTVDASETINRIIDFFPPHQQQQARAMIAGTLKGIVSQRLVPTADGQGRVACSEILVMTGRVHDMILDPKLTGQLPEVISEGAYYGMQTFDQHLLQHLHAGRVTMEAAMRVATSPHDFKLMVAAAGKPGDDGPEAEVRSNGAAPAPSAPPAPSAAPPAAPAPSAPPAPSFETSSPPAPPSHETAPAPSPSAPPPGVTY